MDTLRGNMRDKGFTIVEVLLVLFCVGVLIVVVVLMANAAKGTDWSTPSTASAVEEKPATKTRCDLTGVMASSIIKDEAAKGYEFTGRVNTLLCGDSGLSFQLKEVN